MYRYLNMHLPKPILFLNSGNMYGGELRIHKLLRKSKEIIEFRSIFI